MRNAVVLILASIAVLLVFAVASPAAPTADDLTGKWSCSDGGTYYLRQAGNELWWSGKSNKGTFANIFHGTIEGAVITGSWVDHPEGKKRGAGTLTLEIVRDGNKLTLKKKKVTGGFGGATWTPEN